jgi:hypothetical protein
MAVDEDRAGTALSLIAALLGARKMQSLAQKIKKRNPWRQRQFVSCAVDRQGDRYGQCRGRVGQWDLGLVF